MLMDYSSSDDWIWWQPRQKADQAAEESKFARPDPDESDAVELDELLQNNNKRDVTRAILMTGVGDGFHGPKNILFARIFQGTFRAIANMRKVL